jgi:hypothetical protein
MSNDDWIAVRIADALASNVNVNEDVVAIVYKLLNGELAERQLNSKELAIISRDLIAAMSQTALWVEAK